MFSYVTLGTVKLLIWLPLAALANLMQNRPFAERLHFHANVSTTMPGTPFMSFPSAPEPGARVAENASNTVAHFLPQSMQTVL